MLDGLGVGEHLSGEGEGCRLCDDSGEVVVDCWRVRFEVYIKTHDADRALPVILMASHKGFWKFECHHSKVSITTHIFPYSACRSECCKYATILKAAQVPLRVE